MKYNGWSNYETWRVNLEMLDGSPEMATWSEDELEEYCREILSEQGEGLCFDYAIDFLRQVNWRETREHLHDMYCCHHCNEPTEDVMCEQCESEQETMTSYDKG